MICILYKTNGIREEEDSECSAYIDHIQQNYVYTRNHDHLQLYI